MPCPPRPQLRLLPEFAGTARIGTVQRRAAGPARELRAPAYAEGRSLREIGELVHWSQTAMRKVLAKYQVPRRPVRAAHRDT